MLKITKSLSILIPLTLSVFTFQGNLYAQDYDFQQLDDEWGLVVMEAENYSEMLIPGTAYWELVQEPEFYSGEGAMQALPLGHGAYGDAAAALTNAPVLNYVINFIF